VSQLAGELLGARVRDLCVAPSAVQRLVVPPPRVRPDGVSLATVDLRQQAARVSGGARGQL